MPASSSACIREGATLIVEHLCARGILSADQLLSERTSFRLLAGRNLVFEAKVGELELIVKQYRPELAGNRGRREAAFYRLLLSSDGKALRSLAPRCFDYDDRSRRLLTERVRGEDASMLVIRTGGGQSGIWPILGKRLRVLHSTTASLTVSPSIPKADHPFLFGLAAGEERLRPRTPSARSFLSFLRSQRPLVALMSRARSHWQDRCLIHSDLRLGNVLAIPDSADVRIIDWESFGSGDPRWDVAKLVASAAYCLETFDGTISRASRVCMEILKGYGAGSMDRTLCDFSTVAFLQFLYEDMQIGKPTADHAEALEAALSLPRRIGRAKAA